MAKDESINITYGETISQKGSFSSKKLVVSKTIILNNTDNVDEIYSKTLSWIKEKVEKEKE